MRSAACCIQRSTVDLETEVLVRGTTNYGLPIRARSSYLFMCRAPQRTVYGNPGKINRIHCILECVVTEDYRKLATYTVASVRQIFYFNRHVFRDIFIERRARQLKGWRTLLIVYLYNTAQSCSNSLQQSN